MAGRQCRSAGRLVQSRPTGRAARRAHDVWASKYHPVARCRRRHGSSGLERGTGWKSAQWLARAAARRACASACRRHAAGARRERKRAYARPGPAYSPRRLRADRVRRRGPFVKRFSVAILALVLCASSLVGTGPVSSADKLAQTVLPPGAVVGLQGTVHLWIADQDGVLHWGGDTRALQGLPIDWNTRIDVTLDTLRTLQIGDPYLSAGLLKDGTPIYLVKWETTDTVPRLLHIQCIHDVEVFGINGDNYGKFVLDRDQWEARYGIPVSTLQK